MSEVEIWTDGACSGNPGPGGWACILRWGGRELELSGGDPGTTNNRMEMMAVISGLEALRRPAQAKVILDSSYVMDPLAKGWLEGWKRRGWMTSARKPVANQDLWLRLEAAIAPHAVRFERVKGHAGVELNERADRLAVAACQAQRRR